jgi:hypothetical protein
MKTKTKNSKVPKSAKTRLIDLTPSKDARGGLRYLEGGPNKIAPYVMRPVANNPKQQFNTI